MCTHVYAFVKSRICVYAKGATMKLWKIVLLCTAVAVAGGAGRVALGIRQTEAEIAAHRAEVARIGAAHPAPAPDPARIATLPAPVQRYLRFAVPGPVPRGGVVHLAAKGQFRRPQTESFAATTAEQVIATGTPALMFSATTPIGPLWARAYDVYAEGRMTMKAKIVSTLVVVDEHETPDLDRISLRRWLLESALYPQALLPGGPVTWEPIDDSHARAVVRRGAMTAAMVAEFDAAGRMVAMRAEEDGDLTTPWHGSGEHVTRADYRAVEGVMIPHRFTISRAAGGRVFPFWRGEITAIRFAPGQDGG